MRETEVRRRLRTLEDRPHDEEAREGLAEALVRAGRVPPWVPIALARAVLRGRARGGCPGAGQMVLDELGLEARLEQEGHPPFLAPRAQPRSGLPSLAQRRQDGAWMRPVPARPDGAPFYMDRTPVSVEQYRAYLDATDARPPPHWRELRRYRGRPLVGASRDEARAYARWVGGRLPSLDEWSHASYGDGPDPYPWGAAPPQVDRAWFDERGPSPVGHDRMWMSSLPLLGARLASAGPYGHLDLVGTVWEWVDDPGGPGPGFGFGPGDDDEDDADQAGAAVGACYHSSLEDLRRGVVLQVDPADRAPDVGFRVVIPVD